MYEDVPEETQVGQFDESSAVSKTYLGKIIMSKDIFRAMVTVHTYRSVYHKRNLVRWYKW